MGLDAEFTVDGGYRPMPLKIAVIGGGNIAQKHLPVLQDLADADLESLVDANPHTLQESADRFDIPKK